MCLAVIDAVTLSAAFAVALVIVDLNRHQELVPFAHYAWLLLSIFTIWLASFRVFGLYRSAGYLSKRQTVVSALQVQCLASLVLFSVMYLMGSEFIEQVLLPTFVVVSWIFIVIQKMAVVCYLNSAFRRADVHRRKVVLVSEPNTAQRYLDMIRRRFSMSADVVQVLTPTPIKVQSSILDLGDIATGNIDELPALLQAKVVDEVIAVSPMDHGVLESISRCCAIRGVLLRVWLELPCPGIGHWAAEYFGNGAFLVSLASIPENPVFLFSKRLIDVVGAVVGMIFCALVYLRYGPVLHRETGGSAIFRQQRVGRNGRAFTLYKFRTMRIEAEQLKSAISARNEMEGPIFKIRSDPRVTSTGRKLRRRHLDELPQFWNVLKGDMSLVGTRPPTPDETAAYDQHHFRRLSFKPGITGLWQLNGNEAVSNFEEVVKLDCNYIDGCSLWLDARILTKTVRKILRGDGW